MLCRGLRVGDDETVRGRVPPIGRSTRLEGLETTVEIGQSFFHVRIVKSGCHHSLLLTGG